MHLPVESSKEPFILSHVSHAYVQIPHVDLVLKLTLPFLTVDTCTTYHFLAHAIRVFLIVVAG
jgi:hypothetical protein